MGNWVKISTGLLDAYGPHKLTHKQWVKAFYQAAEGKGGPLAEWVQPCSGRPGQSEWSRIRSAVYARDDYTCQYCGERGKKLECDHVIPLSRGGSNDMSNLKTACFRCNRSKRDKTLEEWKAQHDGRAA